VSECSRQVLWALGFAGLGISAPSLGIDLLLLRVEAGSLAPASGCERPQGLPYHRRRCYESSRREARRCLRFLERQLRRDLPGVYEAVITGHRESPPVQRIRHDEAPEVTGGDSSRQLPITRMKGSPVRVRASALASFAGISSARATAEEVVRVPNGTSFDRFTVSEGVRPPGRVSLISRQFGRGGGSRWPHPSARKCPRMDARDVRSGSQSAAAAMNANTASIASSPTSVPIESPLATCQIVWATSVTSQTTMASRSGRCDLIACLR
jgi:hypothetical protein